MAVLRDVLAGMVAAVLARARDAVRRAAAELPEVPAEIPVLHFADALELIGTAGGTRRRARPRPRRTSGALGEWAVREHGSGLLFVDGLPDGEAALLHPPRPGPARLLATASTCSSAAWSWSPAASGCTGHADYLAALAARGEDPAPYAGYLRRSGTACRRTAASRSGWSGWSARLAGAANIREVTLFPRDLHRLAP